MLPSSNRLSIASIALTGLGQADVAALTIDKPAVRQPRGLEFWVVILTLCVMTLLSAAETSIITTALPTVLQKLDIHDGYTWVNSVSFLTG
jgi:hypothetical protein